MRQTTPVHEIVVGIDTHKHTHTAVALDAFGARLGTMTAPVNREGYLRIETWARAFGPVRAFGIEGTGSYGAGLSRALRKPGTASSRSTAPTGVHAGGAARMTRSTPRPRHARCSAGRRRPNRSRAPARSR